MIHQRSVIMFPTFLSLGLMGAFHAFWGTSLPALRTLLNVDIEKAAFLSQRVNLNSGFVPMVLASLIATLIFACKSRAFLQAEQKSRG